MQRERELTEFALRKKLEIMQRTLHDLVHKKKGDLLDPEILQLSQQIDSVINRLQDIKTCYKNKPNTSLLAMNE